MTRIPLSLADCQKLNAVIPPGKGCPGGPGYHEPCPDDWQARIAAGIPPGGGCSYFMPDPVDGGVTITPDVQATLAASPKPESAAVLATIAVAVPIAAPVMDLGTAVVAEPV
jgi:hypothetical protein